MAKRFTDTTIWERDWFLTLSAAEKCAWMYIKDNCDAVGVWSCSFKKAEWCIGEKIDWEALIQKCHGNIKKLNGGGKWWLVDFCKFQYGKLSRDSAPHRSFIKLLEGHGLLDFQEDLIIDKSLTVGAVRKRLTQNKKDEIFLRDEFLCQYCGTQFEKSLLVVDHIIPIVKGGNNDDENLVTSCVSCNSKKTDFDLKAFLSQRDLFNKCSDRVSKVLSRVLNDQILDRVHKGGGLNGVSKVLDTPKEKEQEKEKTPDKEQEQEKEPEKENRARAQSKPAISLSKKETSMIPQLIEIYKKATGALLVIPEDDMAKLLTLFRAHDRQSIVAAYRLHQKDRPGQGFNLFLKDFGEFFMRIPKPPKDPGPECPECKLHDGLHIRGCSRAKGANGSPAVSAPVPRTYDEETDERLDQPAPPLFEPEDDFENDVPVATAPEDEDLGLF